MRVVVSCGGPVRRVWRRRLQLGRRTWGLLRFGRRRGRSNYRRDCQLLGEDGRRWCSVQVTRVQPRDEAAQRQRGLAARLRDAHPVRERCAARGRTRSARHRAMPRVRADVALGGVVRRRHVGTVDEERHAGLVHVEALLQADDVRELDEVGAADEMTETNACTLALRGVAALGGLLARDVERDQSVAELLGRGARGDLGDLLALANRVRREVAMQPAVVARVHAVEVAAHDTFEARAQHRLGDPSAARQLDAEHRDAIGAHNPHPARHAVLPMARLVETDDVGGACRSDQLVVARLRAAAQSVEHLRQTARRDRDAEPLPEEGADLTERHVLLEAKAERHRLNVGAERHCDQALARDRCARQLRGYALVAALAAPDARDVARVLRHDRRNVDNDRALGLARRHDGAAATARRRHRVLDLVVDAIGNGTLRSSVTRLATELLARTRSTTLGPRRAALAALAESTLPLLALLLHLRKLFAQRVQLVCAFLLALAQGRILFFKLHNSLLGRHAIGDAPDAARWKELLASGTKNGTTQWARWDAAKQIHLADLIR